MVGCLDWPYPPIITGNLISFPNLLIRHLVPKGSDNMSIPPLPPTQHTVFTSHFKWHVHCIDQLYGLGTAKSPI